nr:hypothetical protein [uncultured Lachnoclostridium sp.]
MGRFEYKEGILFVGGQVAADSTRAVIAALSAYTGMDIKTTCDSLNQLLQSFDDTLASLKDVAEEIGKLLEVSQDICEPCRHRGTRHGSSIKRITPKQAKANIKWQEKYRPP